MVNTVIAVEYVSGNSLSSHMVIMNTVICIGNSRSSGKYECKIFLGFIGCGVSLSSFVYLGSFNQH
jgi:hypothetical protein